MQAATDADAAASVVAKTPQFSMWAGKTIVEAGDLVILFETHNSITYTYVKPDEIYQNRHGAFHHNDIIGNRYGAKVYSRISKGYMYVLSPTPELWSKALRHRTQIVFTLDASSIIFQTHCAPGKIVIESGTGSGALTTAFARTVAPHGHVYTFEFNATRAQVANRRGVLGPPVPVESSTTTGSIRLDLESACQVGHAKKMLKHNGAFASYSPCMEQVQRTCDALRLDGFDLNGARRWVEEYQRGKRKAEEQADDSKPKLTLAKRDDEMRGHTAFLTFAFKF
ncbi:hypothetical protein DYB32_005774 [Aphanomyces invadans]|uniref:tRNA (adenine(58)-N(1))-methyltransferase n=1 Tax=Aphanomyces invadans TaxID=157072 RepID=A0A418ATI8_9STRA|nr:hypothetical protein DYB32_005774 [Aphanomyces invadans]